MEDVLEYLLYNSEYTLKNNQNEREVCVSDNCQGWIITKKEFENDIILIDSEYIDEVIDCFNFQD